MTVEPVVVESKSDRFKRIVEGRVNRAIKSIDLIGNTSETARYEYTEKQIDAIFNQLRYVIEQNEGRFKTKLERRNFKLE